MRERNGLKLEIMIMSGVHDGLKLAYNTDNGDGEFKAEQNEWSLSIGRQDESDLCLRNDTFVSRLHAYLRWENGRWWLEDCKSTNGTYVESGENDARVTTTIPIHPGDLFRIGHTWMRIQTPSSDHS